MGCLVCNKCCFCIELKLGCFIIAYLSLIGYIVMALSGIAVLTIGGKKAAAISGEDGESAAFAIAVVGVVLLIFISLNITFTIILLIGLHKDKPTYVKAYLIFACLYIVMSIILILIGAGQKEAGTLVESILNTMVNIYFLLVIRSQYLVM